MKYILENYNNKKNILSFVILIKFLTTGQLFPNYIKKNLQLYLASLITTAFKLIKKFYFYKLRHFQCSTSQ